MPKNQGKWRTGRGNIGVPRLSLAKGCGKQCAGQAAHGGDTGQQILGTQLWNWRKDIERRPASI